MHIALITWTRYQRARWTFYPSRSAAMAAAPEDGPWSIADIATQPRVRFPSVVELLKRTRYDEDASVYPATTKRTPRSVVRSGPVMPPLA